MMNYLYTNWGKNTFYNKKILYPKNLKDLKKITSHTTSNFGVCGNLRSFGDTCINKNKLISLKKFTKSLNLDRKKNIITVSSNILLVEMLEKIIPNGYMLSVTPGTKYVSIGGMISNNVIGKNSDKNQLKYLIEEIKLLSPSNKILICSNKYNKKIFDLTVGGFGLTGTILSAKLRLKKVQNQLINVKTIKFNNHREFKKICLKKSKFSVAWIDSHSLNIKKFKGLYYSANYNTSINTKEKFVYKNKKMSFFEKIFLSTYIKSFTFSKIINFFYLNFQFKNKVQFFDKFFYPQDKWLDFNNCYKNGFFQIQFLIPEKKFLFIINKISNFFYENKIKSTFVILKKINENGKYLNFYGKGYSISFDFEKNSNFSEMRLFFNNLINKYNLRLNYSKDSISNYRTQKDVLIIKKFSKELKIVDKNKIYNNEFSKRLKIK
jgi:decaprenylphospho-beta-D-ribofuranose 2-oxidase